MATTGAGGQEAEKTGDFEGQVLLFDAGRRGLVARTESPVVDADEGAIDQRFGGRPKGATNIATKKRLEMYARIAGDPLLASARILAMPTAELAGMLGCTPLEAEKFRQTERALALPYVLSKRPLDVNLDVKTPPSLHLHFPVGAAGQGAAILPGAGGAVTLLEAVARQLAPVIEDEIPEDESVEVSDA